MGRAALGAGAKTKTGAVRVTAAEDERFQKEFGGLGKFLQIAVNAQRAKWHDDDEEKKQR